MKLLFCPVCLDIFNLRTTEKSCRCGRTRGKYLGPVQAEYSGGVPLGFTNISLVHALTNQPEDGEGKDFEAFVIPKNCPTFKKVDPIEKTE